MISKASHFHIFQGSLEVEGLRVWSGFKLSQPALSSTEVRENPGLAHPDMCVSGLLVARALRLRVILLFSIYSNISIYIYMRVLNMASINRQLGCFVFNLSPSPS